MIIPNELEKLYKALQLLTNENDSVYLTYIDLLRNNNYPEGTKLENHHILPRHNGGSDEPSNLIKLSVPHHAITHWLLWKEFNNQYDKIAFTLKISVNEERKSIASKLLQEKYRQEDRLFYNSKYQQAMGSIGGKKGGSAGTSKQYEARRNVGLAYGRQTGILRQSNEVKQFISKYSIWHLTGYVENNKFYTYGNKSLDDRKFFLCY